MAYAKVVSKLDLYNLAKRNGVAMRTLGKYGALSNINAGLVGWWKLDDASGNPMDSSGYGHASTLVNDVTYNTTGGKIKGMIDVPNYADADDDYVSITNNATLENVQEGDYSLAAWVNLDTTPPGEGGANNAIYGIIIKPGFHLGLQYTHSKTFIFSHWLTGSVGKDAVSSAYDPGTWHHLVGVASKTAGTVKLYVDGALNGSTTFTAGTAAREFGTETFNLGIGKPGLANYRWGMDGKLDDVRIYNRALSADDAAALAAVTAPA